MITVVVKFDYDWGEVNVNILHCPPPHPTSPLSSEFFVVVVLQENTYQPSALHTLLEELTEKYLVRNILANESSP